MYGFSPSVMVKSTRAAGSIKGNGSSEAADVEVSEFSSSSNRFRSVEKASVAESMDSLID